MDREVAKVYTYGIPPKWAKSRILFHSDLEETFKSLRRICDEQTTLIFIDRNVWKYFGNEFNSGLLRKNQRKRVFLVDGGEQCKEFSILESLMRRSVR